MDENVIGRNNIGIYRLWLSFTLAMLLFVLPVAFSVLIPILYYPLVGIIVSLTVYLLLKRRRKSMRSEIDCMIIVYVVNRAIFFYSLLVLFLNLILPSDLDYNTFVLNTESGFNFNLFPVLILAPFVALFSHQAFRKRIMYCVFCVACKGFCSERNLCGIIQSREVLNILRVVRANGILLTILGWGYFIFVYDKYTEVGYFDRIVFIGIPVIVILLSEIIITIRYLTISLFKDKAYNHSLFKENHTIIRYIVISEENIFVTKTSEGTYDTPYILYEKYGPSISSDAAKQIFIKQFGNISAEFKTLYESEDQMSHSRIQRYFVVVKNEDSIKEKGMWISLNFMSTLYSIGDLKRVFRNEFYRVSTMLTSHKLFDESGNRKLLTDKLHFSIRDIINDDIDYTDMRWMKYSIRINNSVMDRLKRTFYKYIEGIID